MGSVTALSQTSGTKYPSEVVTELRLDAFCFNWGVYGSLLVTGYIAITGKLNEQIVCRPTATEIGQNLSDQIKNYKSIEGFTLQYCWATGMENQYFFSNNRASVNTHFLLESHGNNCFEPMSECN